MANTTTLDLVKLDGTEILKNFPTLFDGNMDKIDGFCSKLEADLAYIAIKSGQNWQLSSGKRAEVGDYICIDGVLGNATSVIIGGSTNIVEGTNWIASSKGGFNSIRDQIANITTIATPSFTPETGIANNLFIKKYGCVVCVNGYLTATSAFGNNQKLGTIEAGSRPNAVLRFLAGVADAAYSVGDIAYAAIDDTGVLRITSKSGNTYKVCYFSVTYIATN